MPRRLASVPFAILFAFVPSLVLAQAPPEVVASVTAESASNSRVMEHLDHLTNQIGPRLTGSERLTKACEWARDQFKSFGIANARLEEWGTVEVGFDRGKHQGFMKVGNETKPITFGTNAWTPGTNGLVEGPVVLGPAKEDGLTLLRETAKGAWVVRPPACAVMKEMNDICAEAGALGVIANGGDLILTGGNYRTKADALPKLVRVNVHKPDYDALVGHLKENQDVKLAFDIQNHFKGPVTVYNVLADIVGTEKPEEMVIVGGHIDSWDGATGTTDNGTGVATTLEAARLLMKAGAKPKRTIRFMLWSGEEQGLLGSYAWIKAHPEELDKISAVVVHDGGTNYVSGISSTQDMLPAMKLAFEPVIKMLGQTMEESITEGGGGRPFGGDGRGASRPAADESMKFRIRLVGALPRGIGSDHDAFLSRGVPGFFWGQAGRANYTYTHHTQHDLFQAAIPEYQKHSSRVIAVGALGLANLADKLPRSENMSSRGAGAVSRRRLGTQLAGDDDLTIEDFSENSRARNAGMQAGDKIVKIDGVAVKDRNQMSDAMNIGAPKKVFTVVRDKKEMDITIDFAESRPNR
jgi:hypothetical protein